MSVIQEMKKHPNYKEVRSKQHELQKEILKALQNSSEYEVSEALDEVRRKYPSVNRRMRLIRRWAIKRLCIEGYWEAQAEWNQRFARPRIITW